MTLKTTIVSHATEWWENPLWGWGGGQCFVAKAFGWCREKAQGPVQTGGLTRPGRLAPCLVQSRDRPPRGRNTLEGHQAVSLPGGLVA